jgi:hypothetical protein
MGGKKRKALLCVRTEQQVGFLYDHMRTLDLGQRIIYVL